MDPLIPDRHARARLSKHWAKWRAAHAKRRRWTPEELASEEERLRAEIERRIAAGEVTRPKAA